MNVTQERWTSAQKAEIDQHTPISEHAINHMKYSYGIILAHFNRTFNMDGKSIIEIGPGPVACLPFCSNFVNSYIVEPLVDLYKARDLWKRNNIQIISHGAEDIDYPEVDEIWMFNLLPHVRDPDLIIQKSKKAAKSILFFESIDTTTDMAHPFSFNQDYFKQHFGDAVKIFKGGTFAKFHSANCAYGEYKTGK